MALKLRRFVTICAVLLLKSLLKTASLSSVYYQEKCSAAEGIIHNKVRAWIKKDPTIAAALIRLHFHDCAVRGCDGSILLNHRGSERRSSRASLTLRGFQVIDDIKSSLESACPRTVSCADILTAASRDATVSLGGPFWTVDFGRMDGNLTRACKPGHLRGRFVNLDVTTPFRFDAEYYVNLGKKLGLLKTDRVLYSDKRTSPFVSTLAGQPGLFESQFAVSMVKLGNVGGGGGGGEIRWNCNYVNPSG
ncbi:Peroxidase 7 [Linum perenne]